jgi:ADP-ribose pyrophosphatase YjhB (NUDIX family)
MTRVRCVGVVTSDPLDRMLLVRRAHEPGRGLWSIPGGRVEPDETDPAAAAREALEETGLRVSVGALLGQVTRNGPGGVEYVIFDYAATAVGDPVPGDDAVDAQWVDGAVLRAMDRRGWLVDGLYEALRRWRVLPA